MELTLSTHLLVYGRLDDLALRALGGAGRRLEVWLAEPHVPWRDASALDAFRGRLGDAGLSTGSVHLPFYPSVPELLEDNRRWSLIDPSTAGRAEALQAASDGLHAAGALGAEAGVLHLGWQRDAWDAHSHGWAREAVVALLPVARAAGVRLLLENIISPGTRVAALMALLDEVDPAREVGLCVDLGHAHVDGGVLEELQAALPRLAHLHVHDNDGCSDQHLPPGAGTIPWERVLALLAETGYAGQAALELRDLSRGAQGPDAILDAQLREVDAFLAAHRHAEALA